jgi:hypothetical protein
MWIKFFMDDIRIHIDGIGVINEAKLKPSTWMMFRLPNHKDGNDELGQNF